MITFFNNYQSYSFSKQGEIENAISQIATDYGLVIEYLNVIFLSDDELLKINIDFLSHDYYTDIISFNYSEELDTVEGELYISAERVAENAAALGVDMDQEMSRVIIHGMLHFAGFEDSDESLKTEMRSLENKYLNDFLFHVKPDINTSI
jgi:probable rRNA maturation factor